MHYMNIVENSHSVKLQTIETNKKNEQNYINRKTYTFADQIKMLTKILYKKHCESAEIELDPTKFQQMIEESNSDLSKKSIVELCYIMAGIINKFTNDLKLEIGLYLSSAGTSSIAINTLHSIGFSVCYKTVNNYKKKLVQEHPQKIQKLFFTNNNYLYVYNLDDYHNIHEKRQCYQNNATLSAAKHIATCVCKQISACAPIPFTFNNIPLYNPFQQSHAIVSFINTSFLHNAKQYLNIVSVPIPGLFPGSNPPPDIGTRQKLCKNIIWNKITTSTTRPTTKPLTLQPTQIHNN
ncbi:hypothetical protein Glove_59g65 [Diversispora epigaea]|uniref:Uncharacterized protein n=1 Tax=Diversispora epigaea TaxID=1348612 RepID=A0A397JLM4_9GLOM|nr:hypothetical protein Glove_59g65 [Diversispora epigaea]